MLKTKLSELQELLIDKVSKEIYARVIEPEMKLREEMKKKDLDLILKDAILNTEKAEKHLTAIKNTVGVGAFGDVHLQSPKVHFGSDSKQFELAKTYSTFAGVDVRVFITDQPWVHKDGQKDYGNCQAISWVIDHETKEASGTIIDLLLDHVTLPEGKYITVAAFNEYGKACVVFEGEDFKVLSTQSGVSIDDIIMEQEHVFTCKYKGAYPLPKPIETFSDMPVKPTFEDWD